MQAILQSEHSAKVKRYTVATVGVAGNEEDSVNECAIPLFDEVDLFDVPDCENRSLKSLAEKLFRCSPGKTTVAEHYIPTTGSPIHVPPRRIPAHYREQVEKQIMVVLEQGIIEESSSPWMAPVVVVPKQSGEIRLCVDY